MRNTIVLEVEDPIVQPIELREQGYLKWTLAVSAEEARNTILPAQKTGELRVMLTHQEEANRQTAITLEQLRNDFGIAHGQKKKRSSK